MNSWQIKRIESRPGRSGRRPGAALAGWVGAVTRLAAWIVPAWMLATALACYYTLENLGVYTDTADMVSEELPFRQTHEKYQRQFPRLVDQLVVVVEGRTPELARNGAAALRARLDNEKGLFNTVYAPQLEPFFQRHGLLYQSLAELEDLADNLAGVQPFLAKLATERSLRGLLSLLGDALDAVREGERLDLAPVLEGVNEAIEAALDGRFYRLSWQALLLGGEAHPEDGRFIIIVQPNLDYASLFPAEPAMQAIRRYAHELGIDESRGLRLRLTGGIALDEAQLQSASRGAGIAAGGALVLVLAALLLGLRSLRLVFAALLTLLSGLILTAAFAAAAVGHLNLISVAFAVLYIGLGIDFAIHLGMRYHELVETGEPGPQALESTARSVGRSLILCTLTTAIGFYAFVPTAYAGVAELGLIAGTGMFIGLATSLTFMPALLHLWPPSTGRSQRLPSRSLPDFLARLPVRHGAAVRRGALVLAAASLLLLPLLNFDANPLNLQDPDDEAVATFRDLSAQSETSLWSATVLAPNAAGVQDYIARLNRLGVVDEAVSLYSFVPDDQAEKLALIDDIAMIVGPLFHGTAQPAQPTPNEQLTTLRDTLATLDAYLNADNTPWPEAVTRLRDNLQVLRRALQAPGQATPLLTTLERGLLGTLPETLARLQASLGATSVRLSDLPAALRERWVSHDGTHRIAVYPREAIVADLNALRAFVSGVRTVAPDATDEPVLVLEYGDAVVKSFRQALSIALIMIVVVLLVTLRNLVDTLLVLAPLLLAALLTCAALVVLGIPLNFANIIALPLLLGIGVDNGIHMLREMRVTPRSELLRTSTARAVLFSALTTVFSFGSLGFSAHPGMAGMGQLLTIGVFLTLVATLLVLPALAGWRRSRPA